MKITRISAHQVHLPRQAVFTLSGGRSVGIFDTTIVIVETDAGITGIGEVCPFGSAYLPAFAAGARAGIAELAPQLLGMDPRGVETLYRRMDFLLKGHPYAKSALDIAFWDIRGKAAGLPLHMLLGGHEPGPVHLYQPISHDTAQRMATQVSAARDAGYRRFQPKIGADPEEDVVRIRGLLEQLQSGETLVADANGGYQTHQAKRFVSALAGSGVCIEQPCASYEECLAVRGTTALPFVLDESIDGLPSLLRAARDGAADLINLKLAKVGGLTPARQIRDLCVSLGIAMTIEDSGGGDVIAAACTHLAQSTPSRFRYAVCNAYFLVQLKTTDGLPAIREATVEATSLPGLGLQPRLAVLGDPIFVAE